MLPNGLKLAFLIACMLASSTLPVDAAETLVRFKRTIDSVESKEDKKPEQRNHKADQLTVGLGKDYIWLESPENRIIYDFARKRMIGLDLNKHTYVDDSLYSDVAFRSYELLNRMALNKVLSSVKADIGVDGTSLEDLFGIDRPGISMQAVVPKYTVNRSGTTLQFQRDGRTIVEYTPGQMALDEHGKNMLVRFLAYGTHLHPEIRRTISDTARIPQKITFQYSPHWFMNVTETLELDSAQVTDRNLRNEQIIPQGFVAENSPADLTALLAAADTKKSKPDEARAAAEASAALTRGNRLEAMLALMEYGLSTGNQPLEEVKKLRVGAENDTQFELFIDAMGRPSSEAATAEQQLDKIDRSKLAKAYELDIYKANFQQAQGQPNKAKELFMKALRINPGISGAWADMGDAYLAMFDVPFAWRCYDEARKLAPSNPMLDRIDKMESRLKSSYPDFF